MLKIDGVSKTYANGAWALDGVSLTVRDGESVAIVGGSGCGKSTLLRVIAGLEPISHGMVEVDGQRISSPHEKVGLIFQEPRLLPWLTVAENVAFGIDTLSKAEQADRVTLALAKMELADFGSRWPRELSGGQGQRVAVARALVARPSVLLLDEPFSALDAFTRLDLQQHLLELWAESRPTLVMVTHDIDEALLVADRIVVMRPNPGQIANVIAVDLPRPRDRLAAFFETAKHKVMRALDATLPHRKLQSADESFSI